MEREIKFRIWDKKYSKMIFEGFHLLGEVMAFNEIEIYLFETKKTDGVATIERWNDLEIMQFTGRKDKKEVEIYEGDIVKIYFKSEVYTEKVEWGVYNDDEYVDHIECWMAGHCPLSDLGGMYGIAEHTYEVVGTVYENPELLK